MGPKDKKAKLGTKPEDVKFSTDENVNSMLHKFTKEFTEGMAKDGEEEDLHELDDSVPLSKRDDHLED